MSINVVGCWSDPNGKAWWANFYPELGHRPNWKNGLRDP